MPRQQAEAMRGPILLSPESWPSLVAEREDRAQGRDTPVRWPGLLDDLSKARFGAPARCWTAKDLVDRRGHLIAWVPSWAALASAFTRAPLTYICWGAPAYRGAKAWAFNMLLSGSTRLVVNEEVTQRQVIERIGRMAPIVPYFIDTDFFAFRPSAGRESFLFCNGTNDRDPEMLVALAELGHEIRWLCNDPTLIAAYSARHPGLRIVTRPTYPELRNLYQSCAAAILPVAQDVHAAGQTTGMEAIACGAPLLISDTRAARILAPYPSVAVVPGSDAGLWSARIKAQLEVISQAPAATAKAAEMLQAKVSQAAVRSAWLPFIDVAAQPAGETKGAVARPKSD